jgi:chromosome segregation ATPase|tara:strand:- start:1055 stop:1444 length:390 start_codon:yes stop_codon:yes gene_type:complete
MVKLQVSRLQERINTLQDTTGMYEKQLSSLTSQIRSTKNSLVSLQGLDKYIMQIENTVSNIDDKMMDLRQLGDISQETSNRAELETKSLQEDWIVFKSNLELREFELTEKLEASFQRIANQKFSMIYDA